MPDLFVASYVVLWALFVASVVALVGVARQLAILTSRMRGSDQEDSGPKLGETALPIAGRELAGAELVVAPPYERRTAFVFMSDTCGACDHVLPALLDVAEEVSADTDVWILLEREPPSGHSLGAPMLPRRLISPQAFQDWGVFGVPYSYLAVADGKLEAKGELPKVDRLRESLGLEPVAASEVGHEHKGLSIS